MRVPPRENFRKHLQEKLDYCEILFISAINVLNGNEMKWVSYVNVNYLANLWIENIQSYSFIYYTKSSNTVSIRLDIFI